MTEKEEDQACKKIAQKPDIEINQEVLDQITRTSPTLPIIVKGLFEYKFRKQYSLRTNEYLQCQWDKYKRDYVKRVIAPFQFPEIRHYHFYKCDTRLVASESMHIKESHRFKLKAGPGVDIFGQMPIPQEALYKRGTAKIKGPKERTNAAKKAGNKEEEKVDHK